MMHNPGLDPNKMLTWKASHGYYIVDSYLSGKNISGATLSVYFTYNFTLVSINFLLILLDHDITISYRYMRTYNIMTYAYDS